MVSARSLLEQFHLVWKTSMNFQISLYSWNQFKFVYAMLILRWADGCDCEMSTLKRQRLSVKRCSEGRFSRQVKSKKDSKQRILLPPTRNCQFSRHISVGDRCRNARTSLEMDWTLNLKKNPYWVDRKKDPILLVKFKVNSVQEACAKCFVVHILKFDNLQTTWKLKQRTRDS